MKFLSKKEINNALRKTALSKTHKDRNFAMLQVLSKTGVRVSELINITPKDFLLEESQLVIKGKGNNVRNVDIPLEVVMYLQAYEKNFKIKRNKPYFPLTRQHVRRITYKLANINPHGFRHSYAIHLLRQTKNVRYVQNQLGHSSLAVTEIYLKYMEFEEDKQKLNGMFDNDN